MPITSEELSKIEGRFARYLQNAQLISEITIKKEGGLKNGPAHALACALIPQILQEVEIIDD